MEDTANPKQEEGQQEVDPEIRSDFFFLQEHGQGWDKERDDYE
jgi:hypothetical protein